jgi:hypothetical protein
MAQMKNALSRILYNKTKKAETKQKKKKDEKREEKKWRPSKVRNMLVGVRSVGFVVIIITVAVHQHWDPPLVR